MKKTGQCPKCQSRQVVRVPGGAGAHGSGNNITMGLTIFSAIPVTRYVCGACGLCEDWIDDAADLEKIVAKFGKHAPS